MKLNFRKVRVAGVLVVVPENESRFEDELPNYNFPERNSRKMQQVIGIDRHRVVQGETCASDLAIYGVKQLFEQGQLTPDEIDALILVTETPDYFMPPTSNVIQDALGLGEEVCCLDINQGCAGFVVGLAQGFMMLEREGVDTVVLINADTLSRTCSPRDRNAYPILGDAASIAVLRKSESGDAVHSDIRMDGSQHRAIMIPAGGFRVPKSAATAERQQADDGNIRSQEDYHMDGIAVLNFVQTRVPLLVDEMLEGSGHSKDSIDWFLFHQPNRFMLEKLADQMGVPREKMPNRTVETFGNVSSATIPITMAHAVGDRLLQERFRCCLCGFGVGLTWAGMLMELGPLEFLQIIDYPDGDGA